MDLGLGMENGCVPVETGSRDSGHEVSSTAFPSGVGEPFKKEHTINSLTATRLQEVIQSPFSG